MQALDSGTRAKIPARKPRTDPDFWPSGQSLQIGWPAEAQADYFNPTTSSRPQQEAVEAVIPRPVSVFACSDMAVLDRDGSAVF